MVFPVRNPKASCAYAPIPELSRMVPILMYNRKALTTSNEAAIQDLRGTVPVQVQYKYKYNICTVHFSTLAGRSAMVRP